MHPDSIIPYEAEPTTTYDYYVKARSGNKRDYVYSFSESRGCSHSRLREFVVGSGEYLCEDCNYVFIIVSAKQIPLHHALVKGMQTALWFSKEFGQDALQEVLRKPMGQHDGRAHKSVLPEGASFEETFAMLEEVNVNSGDEGLAELKELRDTHWVSQTSRKRRLTELAGIDEERIPLRLRQYRDEQEALDAKSAAAIGEGSRGEDGTETDTVPSLPEEAGEGAADRDS
jgi:hypothetical protein